MNLLFKRGLQLGIAVAALSTTACVIDPYYSGVDYGGTTVYPTNSIHTQTVYNNGNNTALALTTGFLIGNAYYWNDRYYPVSYYTDNNRRYYRPDFNRPSRFHPDNRYRNLNQAQLNHWRHNQASYFDPKYRPNLNAAQRQEIMRQQQWRPNNHRPNVQNRPDNRPKANQPQVNRPQVNKQRPQLNRPQTNTNRPPINTQRPQQPQVQQQFGPNLNATQRQEIIRQQQNRTNPVRARSASEMMNNRRMNER